MRNFTTKHRSCPHKNIPSGPFVTENLSLFTLRATVATLQLESTCHWSEIEACHSGYGLCFQLSGESESEI